MGSAIEDAWDSTFGGDSIFGQAWSAIGGTEAWEGGVESIAGFGGVDESLASSASKSKSACGGGSASAKAADRSAIPAVAQSISGDAAKAVEAQGLARKRARGIMQTYTRYDYGGNGGKSKLGE